MTKITYIDHSGFAVVSPAAILVFDYFRDPANVIHRILENYPGLPVFFFVSHHHADHFNPAIFNLAQNRKPTYILSYDIESKHVIDKGMQVAYMAPGDNIDSLPGGIAVKAYKSTDAGVSFVVTMPDGSRIFHAGDLNDWRWSKESSDADVRKADEMFQTIVGRIAADNPHINIAMFPVDLRQDMDAARGARIFLDKIQVDNFFPMHINGRAEDACDFKAYNPRPEVTKCFCLARPGEHKEI